LTFPALFGTVPVRHGAFLDSPNMTKIIDFLREVRVELGKVAWPTRRQLITYTGIVVAMSLAMAAFLGGLDAVFGYLLNLVI
jgi:preprotein translocase subunit SecE